jgi:hypothetical protein
MLDRVVGSGHRQTPVRGSFVNQSLPCPSITIKVRVDFILSIRLKCHVIVSFSESTVSAFTFTSISYAPYTPVASIIPGNLLSSVIISSSYPKSQFIRTYAVGIITLYL